MLKPNPAERAALLVQAACSGDMPHARGLLADEPELGTFDFFTACAMGEADTVAKHLAADSQLAVCKGGPDDREPILYACFSRFLRTDADRAAGIGRIVKMLLDHGADPNSHYTLESEGHSFIQTSLYAAAGIANNAALTRMLLDAGADPNDLAGPPDLATWSSLGTEALYHASEFHHVACLRMLLDAGPHPLRISYCFGRALDFDNAPAALLYLDHGADPNFRIPWFHNRTHLHRAVMYGRAPEVIQCMIERGGDVNATDDSGTSVYQFAVRSGHPQLAILLEHHGARVDTATDADRYLGACVTGSASPPVAIPADAAADVLCRCAQRGDVAAIRRLLKAGVDPNATGGADGTPPLHWACWRGHADAARVLVEHGASLTQTNRYGGAALGTAIHGSFNCQDVEGGPTMKLPEEITHGQYPQLVEFLINAGAKLPDKISGGTDAVREVLRHHEVAGDNPA
ncbi:MAG: ankyrin repeat-containing protein [Phycisphaerales bacterium]|nr:ankyrin repeat-containing protein [Phycisphaerales bacterium]